MKRLTAQQLGEFIRMVNAVGMKRACSQAGISLTAGYYRQKQALKKAKINAVVNEARKRLH